MKRGKSDGSTLSSDHLVFAPDPLVHVSAPLFSSLVHHGFMPSCYGNALLCPIPKGCNKDYSLSANYRGIALASWFSKLIEFYILEVWGDLLISSQLQFGLYLPHLCALKF